MVSLLQIQSELYLVYGAMILQQLGTKLVRGHLVCGRKWWATLINGAGKQWQVKAVPSNTTLKLCKSFTRFRKENNLTPRKKCKFILVGGKKFIVKWGA